MQLVPFLTGLLADVLRPIIREELGKVKEEIISSIERKDAFGEYDAEVNELMKEMANASTSEERWAVLQKFKNARARVHP